jgi:hypothetical protein
MKKTILGGFFVAIAAGSVGATALNDIQLLGHNALKPLVDQVIAACPEATGLTYWDGSAGLTDGSSGVAEVALREGTRTIAPMSRFLSSHPARVCASEGSSAEAEGLQFAIEPLAMIVSSNHRASCDPDSAPTGTSCQSDVATGLRFSDASPSTTLACGLRITDWKTVLRLIYFGLKPKDFGHCTQVPSQGCSQDSECTTSGDTCLQNAGQSSRDCNDACRVELVDNWGKLFQNACSGGNCTRLQHAFRLDDGVSTSISENFRELLGVKPPLFLPDDIRMPRFPYCNEYSTELGDVPNVCPPWPAEGALPLSLGVQVPPYLELYQDADPIRRTAIGTGNVSLDLVTPPAVVPTEQVASAKGNLGIVLPISVPPLSSTVTNADRHARIGSVLRGDDLVPVQYCTRGVFKNAAAASIAAVAPASTGCAAGPAYALCPNGDLPKGACWDESLKIAIGGVGVCPYPVFDRDGSASTSNDQDFRCISGANNRPNFSGGVNAMSAATRAACVSTSFDGRVYNLHPHLENGKYLTQPYTLLAGETTITRQVPVVGAFYRIHETRTAAPGFAGCQGDRCCGLNDSSDQLGCLVGANPCSIGFAGQNASNQEVTTVPDTGGSVIPRTVFSTSLNGIERAAVCVRNGAYPAQRYMWINTILGYRTGGISGDERGLAECFSGNGLTGGRTIQQLVRDEFTLLMDTPIGCKSFDESRCGDGGPTNSCANNPLAIASLLALREPCTTAAQCASNVCTLGKCSF